MPPLRHTSAHTLPPPASGLRLGPRPARDAQVKALAERPGPAPVAPVIRPCRGPLPYRPSDPHWARTVRANVPRSQLDSQGPFLSCWPTASQPAKSPVPFPCCQLARALGPALAPRRGSPLRATPGSGTAPLLLYPGGQFSPARLPVKGARGGPRPGTRPPRPRILAATTHVRLLYCQLASGLGRRESAPGHL
jgi:hypothetical protein